MRWSFAQGGGKEFYEDYWRRIGEIKVFRDRWPVYPAIEYVKQGDDILELGCGHATLLRCLISNGCRGVGVDFDLNVLQKASAADPSLNLLQMDAANPAFRDESFDSIFMYGPFNFVDTGKVDYLNRIHGLLKPGGSLIFTAYPDNAARKFIELKDRMVSLWTGKTLRPFCLVQTKKEVREIVNMSRLNLESIKPLVRRANIANMFPLAASGEGAGFADDERDLNALGEALYKIASRYFAESACVAYVVICKKPA